MSIFIWKLLGRKIFIEILKGNITLTQQVSKPPIFVMFCDTGPYSVCLQDVKHIHFCS